MDIFLILLSRLFLIFGLPPFGLTALFFSTSYFFWWAVFFFERPLWCLGFFFFFLNYPNLPWAFFYHWNYFNISTFFFLPKLLFYQVFFFTLIYFNTFYCNIIFYSTCYLIVIFHFLISFYGIKLRIYQSFLHIARRNLVKRSLKLQFKFMHQRSNNVVLARASRSNNTILVRVSRKILRNHANSLYSYQKIIAV